MCEKSDTSRPAEATMPTAKSPIEHALADFLKTIDLEGKPTLIEFGMVGCELSDKGLDSMIALHRANNTLGLTFVRVEGSDDAAAVEKYYKDKAVPFRVHQDKRAALAKALSATAMPTFLLIDKFGHIRYQGRFPADDLIAWTKALAAETKNPGGSVRPFGAKELDVPKLLEAKLPGLDGNAKALRQYVGDGGMVVLFVDTSCPFSVTAINETGMVSNTLSQQKIKMVLLNNDNTKEKVLAFYAPKNLGATVLYDTGDRTRQQWNVQSVPIAVYISPVGKIGYQGEAIWANMGAFIENLLGLSAGILKFSVAGTSFG